MKNSKISVLSKIICIACISFMMAPIYSQQPTVIEEELDLKKSEIRWLSRNQIEKDSIIQFYESNSSDESIEFLKAAVEALKDNQAVSFENAYIETPTPDDNYKYSGDKVLITMPLLLSSKDTVIIKFGITKSDKISANQPVSPDLIEAIKHGLEKTNQKLEKSQVIKSIFVMATTNGGHGIKSNHYTATAVDISGINGEKIVFIQSSPQVEHLQKSFDTFLLIRENFGPVFNHKYSVERDKWNYNYKLKHPHDDHIHISVRSKKN